MKQFAVILLAASGCIDVTLPEPPPPPGPGSIQGTAVYAVAGRTGFRPAGGARVTLINTGTSTIADRDTGRFDLRGVRVSTGLLLFAFDIDGDGTIDRQRAIELSSIGAGVGREVALGDVVLSRNATVAGRVLRGDNPLATGHSGTAVFVPGAPFATATADTGDFVLENLPDGPLQLAFYREGYEPESRDLTVRGGEETRVAAASLSASPPTAPSPATVTGLLRFEDNSPVANARVRFISHSTTFLATSDSSGAFSVQTVTPALYQVAIEADGAASLRLYNVLLLPGMNELGTVPLTRGESMPLFVDAGELTPFDGGTGSGLPIAVIDPPLLEVAPGGSAQLSSARSVGRRPQTSHWRSASDGGLQLTFEMPDTTATTVQVFAPDAAGLYPFTLRVSDVVGVESPEARGVVRVGRRPSVSVTAVGGLAIAPGAMVTLRALGVSNDGRLIADYRWTQRTGPPVSFPPVAGDTIGFQAPFVSGLTPMTFEVVATSDLGFESVPAVVTLALQPVTQPTLVATSAPSVVFQDGGQLLIELKAQVMGAPPDAGYVLSWTPSSSGCPLADGGVDLTCPEGWTLSNVTGATTQLFAPRASGNRTLTFTVTAMPGGLKAQTNVEIRDAKPPTCRAFLSTLTYQVQCDEPMVVLGGFDAGPNTPSADVFVNGGLVTAYFHRVLNAGLYDPDISGLVDRGGNPPLPFVSAGLAAQLSMPATWVTPPTVTSTTGTRPAWLRLGSVGATPARWAIVGRATDAASRKLWVLEQTVCTGTCAVTPNVFENIPGQGSQPSGSTSAVSVDGRAYVIVSPSNPSALVEYRDGTWREVPVFLSPELGVLGADGKNVWVMSPGTNGNVERRLWSPGDDGGSYGQPQIVATNLANITSAELAFTPSGKAFSFFVNGGTVESFELTGPLWVRSVGLGFPTMATASKVLMLGESLEQALGFTRISDGQVEVSAFDPATVGTTYLSLGPVTGSMEEYDVAQFGKSALLTWSSMTQGIQLVLVSRSASGGLVASDVRLADGGVAFNTNPGRWPRLAVEGAQIFLSWQEEVAAGASGMAGTIIR
jgi:hypothetical protein